jgi:hypothetical protein
MASAYYINYTGSDYWHAVNCPANPKQQLLEGVQVPGAFRPSKEQRNRWSGQLSAIIEKFHRKGFRARDNRRWLKLQGRVDKWGDK